jgi:hypothetical protein
VTRPRQSSATGTPAESHAGRSLGAPLHAWHRGDRLHLTAQQIVSPLASSRDRFDELEISKWSWRATALDDEAHFEAAPPDLQRKDTRDSSGTGARPVRKRFIQPAASENRDGSRYSARSIASTAFAIAASSLSIVYALTRRWGQQYRSAP